MTMRFFIIFISAMTISVAATAQGPNSAVTATDALERLQQREMKGQVMIRMDSLILENYKKHLVQNSKNRGIEGYRIRIFSDIGQGAKDEQMRVRARFLSLHPQIAIYPDYDDSYFKVYVGDFRTKRDALKVLEIVRKDFPDAFIVEDIIVIDE